MKTKKITFSLLLFFGFMAISCEKGIIEEKPVFELEQADNISEEEYEIYSILINEMYSSSKVVIQQRSGTSFSNLSKERVYNYLVKNNKYVDTNLIDNYFLINSTSYYFENNFSAYDKQIILISDEELSYLFDHYKDLNGGWDKFYKKHPHSNGLLKFTRIGFNCSST